MTTPLPTDRAALLARLAEPRKYDIAVVGGGATGLGVALDAAQRGHSVVLIEAHDFAKGTSSRAQSRERSTASRQRAMRASRCGSGRLGSKRWSTAHCAAISSPPLHTPVASPAR